jgi:hypothetical protein
MWTSVCHTNTDVQGDVDLDMPEQEEELLQHDVDFGSM